MPRVQPSVPKDVEREDRTFQFLAGGDYLTHNQVLKRSGYESVEGGDGMMKDHIDKLNDISLCGIKTAYWREFLKAFQESTTDAQARAAFERLHKRVQQAADLPTPKSQAALMILLELEKLLDLPN